MGRMTVEQARAAYRESSAVLEDERKKHEDAEIAKLDGRAFRYRNSYGASDGRSWWLYGLVVGREFRRFQVMPDNRIEFDEQRLWRGNHIAGWEEITVAEYRKQRRGAIKKASAR